MLIYPNSMSFPIMENGGVDPPPQGMLTVKVLRADKLKGGGALDKLDPFVEVGLCMTMHACKADKKVSMGVVVHCNVLAA